MENIKRPNVSIYPLNIGIIPTNIKNGLLFSLDDNKILLEVYTSRKEKFFELLWRNPIDELLKTFSINYRKNLFKKIKSFSRDPRKKRFESGICFEYLKNSQQIRITEIAKDYQSPTSSQSINDLLNIKMPLIAKHLDCDFIVLETFSKYGNKLLRMGWEINPNIRPIYIRLGAWLNRTKCYAKKI